MRWDRVTTWPRFPKFHTFSNPQATYELGRSLAAEIAPLAPTRLVAWSGLDDAVLAFVVSQELGCPITLVWNDEGLLKSSPVLERGDRIVVVGESFRLEDSVNAVRLLAAHVGATVASDRGIDRDRSSSRRGRTW